MFKGLANKVSMTGGRGVYLVSAFYVFIAGYINNNYKLSIPPTNLICRNHFFYFSGLIFFPKK